MMQEMVGLMIWSRNCSSFLFFFIFIFFFINFNINVHTKFCESTLLFMYTLREGILYLSFWTGTPIYDTLTKAT